MPMEAFKLWGEEGSEMEKQSMKARVGEPAMTMLREKDRIAPADQMRAIIRELIPEEDLFKGKDRLPSSVGNCRPSRRAHRAYR